jgi:fucose permease
MSSLAGNTSAPFVLRFLAVLCLGILLLVVALRFPPAPKAGTRLGSLLSVLGHFDIWLFAALLFFESGSENSMFVWAAKIVGETFHTTRAQANMALVALSAALGAGRLGAMLLLRWLGNQHTILVSSAIAIVGSVIVLTAGQLAGMIVGMLVIGLGLSAIFPTALGMAGDRFPAETGTVFGAITAVALVGGTAGPKLGGWIANFGIRRIFVIPILAATLVAVFTCLIGRGRRPLAEA